MKRTLFISLAIVFAAEVAFALIIEKPKCGPKFYCPDHCNVTWRRGCPHNCFCGPVKYCPAVTCPASYPVCLVFTMFDGCQSCACKIPFAFLKANNKSSSGETRLMYDDPGHLRNMTEGQNFTDEGGQEATLVKKLMCTIADMHRIDSCLRSTIELHKYARERRRDDQPVTINPMVLLGVEDMKALCKLFTDALACIGDDVYEDCRRDHPDLLEMDSLLKYACGPQSPHFFQHLACISDAHRTNPRVQLCEDLFVNALVVVQESAGAVAAKRAQKCRALNWFVKCGRPNVYRHCSPAAADVYAESLMSATEYMDPECHPDYDNERIMAKSEEHADISLTNNTSKDQLPCSVSHQFAVFAVFKNLYNEIRSTASPVSAAFPTAYAYEKTTLVQRCKDFMTAFYEVPVETRRKCYRNYEVFDQVYGVFAYPCAPETEQNFLEHFDCLRSLRKRTEILECENEAERHLADPSVEQCEVYDLLVRCMHEAVERSCGYEAWDTHFQLLSLSVRRYVPHCTLTPVYRPPLILTLPSA